MCLQKPWNPKYCPNCIQKPLESDPGLRSECCAFLKNLSFLKFFDLVFVITAGYFFIPESNRIELDLCMQVFMVRECGGKSCVLKTNA